MGHREIQLEANNCQQAEDRGKKKGILLWERLSAAISPLNDFYDF
jgi:hypothetical protein